MYELGVVANRGVAIPFNNPVNEGEIPVDGPIAPVNVDVPIAPVNALEPDRAGMWTSWTRKNPGWRFFGCPNYMDEEKDCGYFRWIDPRLLNKWYKERMNELGAVANGGVAIPFNNPVNEGEIHVDGPIAPVIVDVPIAPVNALEPDNQIAMRENTHVPGNEFGFCKWMMVCFVCFIVGMMYG
ncbi:unnamed protein product [Lactuca virosa]|uniref:GRF-type domain-containing protein n=1 Tax=Lactuca virosa TaxID=75947 RepID=A0AAU9MZR6_9ASTR|nr:unnamed protein product [Lactuca virosa]